MESAVRFRGRDVLFYGFCINCAMRCGLPHSVLTYIGMLLSSGHISGTLNLNHINAQDAGDHTWKSIVLITQL